MMDNRRYFTWRNIGILINFLVTGLSISLTIFFYLESRSYQSPTYYVSPYRFPILTPEIQVPMEIRLNDQPVQAKYLTAALVYFWNRGSKLIDWEHDVTEPITISLISAKEDPVQLLGVAVYKEPMRDITGFEVHQLSDVEVVIKGKRLYKNQGAVFQVVWKGNPEARIVMSGLVDGDRRPVEATAAQNKWRPYLIVISLASLIVIIIVPFIKIRNKYVLYTIIGVASLIAIASVLILWAGIGPHPVPGTLL